MRTVISVLVFLMVLRGGFTVFFQEPNRAPGDSIRIVYLITANGDCYPMTPSQAALVANPSEFVRSSCKVD